MKQNKSRMLHTDRLVLDNFMSILSSTTRDCNNISSTTCYQQPANVEFGQHQFSFDEISSIF